MSSMKEQRSETAGGFEHITGVKYFGHFLLTHLLLDLLKKSSPSRIINAVCLDYNSGRIDFDDLYLTKEEYNPWHSHFVASLEMIMFTREFGKRFKDTGVTANMVQPGHLDTRFGKLLKERYPHAPPVDPVEVGARPMLYCALEKGIERVTGTYFTAECTQRPVAPHALDDEVASRLWDVTKKMVGLK
ncbi:retinol dehydrogenase 12-like [Amphiura filiformis]|uniref:retinol dehydrogenase 12-like n=1 Tax=Amphiura filiformis TaxID=82378 RepID=UPI003B21788C